MVSFTPKALSLTAMLPCLPPMPFRVISIENLSPNLYIFASARKAALGLRSTVTTP